ncbi:hypothetical protein GDO81_029564 [Engystomops pustulosus]|uniref:Uncharacterized protein n=1 Tax=Engystomops pustulosus TaxID=76066 RepID=A0AAV6Z1J7_ENGPU|nr:hypothetical protein GDO81_029566 [Engystomops pustulosus]KAG8541172.1 hypothetical protein GDO81_029564 [Engystomops pustulosus]
MASAELKDELTCSICLNLYTNPVTLKCGHNFCGECIERFLDTQKGCVTYSCPQCRAEFPERPILQKNTTLRNIAEHFQSREEEEESEVFCTYCVHTSVVASKTCLWCEASLCDTHLTVHSTAPEHALVQPTKSFRNSKCSHHKKVLMYYCLEDAECLCVSCCLGEKHRGHQVELLNEASKKEQEKLRTIQGNIIKEKEEIEKKVHNLQEHLRQIPEKEAGIMEKVGVQFRDLRMKLENLENQVLNEISKKKEQVSLSVSDLIQQQEMKKDDLSRKISNLDQLCQVKDPLLCLQANKNEIYTVGDSNTNVKEVKEDLDEDPIIQALHRNMVSIMSGLQRGYYVQEASGILLDVKTAANNVHVSDDLRTASATTVKQDRPHTPERFPDSIVLSMMGFSERRLYWDVEVSTVGAWRVGMTYPSISRQGLQSYIGNNQQSWSLRSNNKFYSVKHNGKEIQLNIRPSCYKVRIYLDYSAGQMSFYELGISMRHLYTYSATFTEPLYPVITVLDNAWVRVLN